MRGRNTENSIIELDHKTTSYQRIKFIHDEKHIVFHDIETGKKEDGGF